MKLVNDRTIKPLGRDLANYDLVIKPNTYFCIYFFYIFTQLEKEQYSVT